MDPPASPYGDAFLEHFRHPRGAGALSPATLTHRGRAEDGACGDQLTLDLRVEAGRVLEARWRAEGCMGAIACASALATIAPGRAATRDGLAAPDLEAVLGPLPPGKRHALRLTVEAWKAALSGEAPPG